MSEPLKLKGRHPVRAKDVTGYNEDLERMFAIAPLPAEGTLVERARAGEDEVVLVGGQVFLLLSKEGLDGPMPTLRALMAHRPQKAWVTVDMGAVPFLRNGADVMSPGITEADETIAEGQLVWVRDEKHGVPLALGKALMDGPTMAAATKGKAITTLHYVGDELWNIGVE